MNKNLRNYDRLIQKRFPVVRIKGGWWSFEPLPEKVVPIDVAGQSKAAMSQLSGYT